MSLRIENLNSQEADYFLSARVLSKTFSRLGFLFNVATKVPTFLVDKETINKIPATMVIDEDRLRGAIEKWNQNREKKKPSWYEEREESEKPNKKFEELERLVRESLREPRKTEKVLDLIGVYLPEPPTKDQIFQNLPYPCILICPEKIVEISNSPEYVGFEELEESEDINLKEVLFSKVYYHELGHAYLRYPEGRDWKGHIFEIVEESYCNAVAFERFSKPSEISIVSLFISQQPLEYRGYMVFMLGSTNLFAGREIREMFYHYYRRYYYIYERYYEFWRLFREYGYPLILRGFRNIWNDVEAEHLLVFLSKVILSEVMMIPFKKLEYIGRQDLEDF